MFEPGDVLDDCQLELRSGAPGAVGDQLGLECVDEALGHRELAIAAAHIAPPPYVKWELGERSGDPTKRKAWDRGVEEIETYRQRHGVNDPNRALGRERERETLRRIQEA